MLSANESLSAGAEKAKKLRKASGTKITKKPTDGPSSSNENIDVDPV